MMGDHRAFASTFQNAHFVLEASSAGTWWGFYVQALRELHSRVRSLQLGLIELERKRRSVSRLEVSVDVEDSDLDLRKARIELDDQNHLMREMHRQLQLFYSYALHARSRLPSEITSETRDRLDREYWVAELGRKAWTEALAGQPVNQDTWRTLLALPPDMADQVKHVILHPNEYTGDSFKLDVPRILENGLPELQHVMREIEQC
jgi:hypothetical protein